MEIINKDRLWVIGMPVTASWDDLWVEMPKAWKRFFDRHAEITDVVGDRFIDVSLHQDDDRYLQLVGVEVSEIGLVPQNMQAVDIPAQSYIHHTHVGAVSDIAGTFGDMYDWAKRGEARAGSFKLDIGYSAGGDERTHELYIGILPETPWKKVESDTTR